MWYADGPLLFVFLVSSPVFLVVVLFHFLVGDFRRHFVFLVHCSKLGSSFASVGSPIRLGVPAHPGLTFFAFRVFVFFRFCHGSALVASYC